MAKATVKSARNVPARKIQWLIDGMIPRGRLTIMDGDPGQGKSFLTLEIAAAVSKGQKITSKGRRGSVRPENVLILNAEDDIPATMKPRLEVLDVDLDRVFFMGDITHLNDKGVEKQRSVTFPYDAEVLAETIETLDVGLVVIDPVMAYLDPEVRTASDQAVRAALAPLKRMAERFGCAMIMVRHMNKSGGGKVLYRGGGSIGIVGLTRAAIYVGPNPEEKDEKVMAQIKNNLGPLMTPWGFKICADDKGLRGIKWLGDVDMPVSRILDAKADMTPREQAMAWLTDLLVRGNDVSVTDIMAGAKREGIKYTTLIRAKKELGVKTLRVGARSFLWTLERKPKSAGSLFDTIKAETGP